MNKIREALEQTVSDRTWTPDPTVIAEVDAFIWIEFGLDHLALPESLKDLIARLAIRVSEES